MKKIFACLLFGFIFTTLSAFADELVFGGIGAQVFKDGKKAYIIRILPNGPAEKANVPIGSEILLINDQKIKPLAIKDIISLLRGPKDSSVTLLIKNGRTKELYTIQRDVVSWETKSDTIFDLHWKQIAPEGYENTVVLPIFPHYSNNLNQEISTANYWAERKNKFKKGFDACKTYAPANRDACYMNLVNREIGQTQADEERARQDAMIRMQATQNIIQNLNHVQTNTQLNDINNSIRQNNFQLQNTNMQLYNINNTLRGW